MSSLITDIVDYLDDQGIGTTGTNLFEGYIPDAPDTCIAVLNTGGTRPDPDIPTKSPTFQVFIRATSFAAGQSRLDQVREALHRQSNIEFVTDETYVYYVLALAEGGHVGRDENGRDLFSINFKALTR
ncbi:MAG TPA: minor capsid protein [Vitreimonas sp.]|nr:minor capsid protein [Vitreimonas sp.]